MTPPGWLCFYSDWPFKAAEAAVHLSNWLRTLKLPQLTGGLLANMKENLVWFGLGQLCLGAASLTLVSYLSISSSSNNNTLQLLLPPTSSHHIVVGPK